MADKQKDRVKFYMISMLLFLILRKIACFFSILLS